MKIKNEIAYQITMKYIKQMLEKNLITEEEYNKLSDEFKEKYTAKISHLFLENRWYYLIYTYFRVIYSNKENGGKVCEL